MLSRLGISSLVLVAAMATHCDAQNLVFQRVSASSQTASFTAARSGTNTLMITNDSDTSSGSAPQCVSGSAAGDGIGPNDFAQVSASAQANFNPDGQIVSQLMCGATSNMNLRSTDTPSFGNLYATGGGTSELEIVDLTGGGGTFDVKVTIKIKYNWQPIPGGDGVVDGDDPYSGFYADAGFFEGATLQVNGNAQSGEVEVSYPDDTYDYPSVTRDGNDREIEVTYTWENVPQTSTFGISGGAGSGGIATIDADGGDPVALTRVGLTITESRLEIIQN